MKNGIARILACLVVLLGIAGLSSSSAVAAKPKTATQWICEEQVEANPNGWGNYCYGPTSGNANVQSFLTVIEQQNAARGQKDLVILYSGLHQSLDSQYILMLSSNTGCVNDGYHLFAPAVNPAKMGSIDARVDALLDHPPIHMHDSVASARSTDNWANGAHCDVGFGPYGWDNPQAWLPSGCDWSPMYAGYTAARTRYDLNSNIGPIQGDYAQYPLC